jgi:hypothetical protein
MTLPLTAEILEACYEFLRTTPPFRSWHLPESEDVKFQIVRDRKTAGWHKMDNRKHIIGISRGAIGRTHSLVEVMAHEMCHAHQRETNMETKNAEHNAAFKKLAERVCKIHGFDPLLF